VQQPANQSVAAGAMASFTVIASGAAPLSYQWQKSSLGEPPFINLGNGGHYSGCTTPTLIITGADTNDVASYRCAVTNAYGYANSGAATLAVLVPNSCISINNPNFESGFALAGGGYIANGWTEWEAEAGVVIGYDEGAIVHGGAHAQRIRVSSTGATSGGVYQRVPVTAGNVYLVSGWMYADDSLTSCYLGVDPAGGTDVNSGVTWCAASTNMAWEQRTWGGVATSDYLTVYLKVASPDSVKRNGYFDDVGPSSAAGSQQLDVQGDGTNLTLNWPECPAAHLEHANSLTLPMNWTTVTNQVSIANGQKSVTLAPTQSAGFYRLVLE